MDARAVPSFWDLPAPEVVMSEPGLSTPGKRPESPADDRRDFERHASEMQLFCQPGSARLDQFWWVGELKDVSARGLGLTTRQQFDPGTILSLEVKTLEECNALPPEARVVHATPLTNGRWLIGCILPQPLSEQELRALMSRSPAPT